MMRTLFGWRQPSLGRHRLGNPAYPNLVHRPAHTEPLQSHHARAGASVTDTLTNLRAVA